MEMKMPPGMYRRGKAKTLYARKDVPKPLQAVLGTTSLKRSLHTGDIRAAMIPYHQFMADAEKQIARARNPRPEDPIIIEVKPEWGWMRKSTKPVVLMDELFERWMHERSPRHSHTLEVKRAVERWIALNKDLPIAEYTSEHARAWKDYVLAMTNNGQPLAYSTLKHWFDYPGVLFRFAERSDLIDVDPFLKVKLERPKSVRAERRAEWTMEDLGRWFSGRVFTQRFRPDAGAGEAAHWFVPIGLLHGFRLAEIAQLHREGIRKQDGIWTIQTRGVLKNDSSERVVPVHDRLIEAGFLSYVETIESGPLFPEIKIDAKQRWSGHWGRWFGRERRKLGLRDRLKDFHSLRHNFLTAARTAQVPEDHRELLAGHEPSSVHRTYGRVAMPLLKASLDRVAFDVTIPKWKP
jgi:integrase